MQQAPNLSRSPDRQRSQCELDALDAVFREYGSSSSSEEPGRHAHGTQQRGPVNGPPAGQARPRSELGVAPECRPKWPGSADTDWKAFSAPRPSLWARLSDWVPAGLAVLVVVSLWWALAQQVEVTGTRPVTAAADSAQRPLQVKPIREIQLGERIQGRNPLREQVEDFEPDPATWRDIHLQMRKSAGGALTIELLRPMEWIEAYGAQPGSTVHLDLHEMGAVGDATVIAINPCPPIQTGVGTVVTGKFVHQCAPGTGLVYLRIEGQSEPTGVTDNHPYWSVDRQDFVPVGELRVGELVETEFGAKRVQSVEFWTGFEGLLYNLETTEHVFRVGSVGTLVHNGCAVAPYAEVGGHHIFSKRAFEGVTGYKEGGAFSIGRTELSRLGLKHLGADSLTTTQQRLFRELAASGRANTLAEHARIARQTLTEHGVDPRDAQNAVRKALNQLRSWGITNPVHIPWGG